MPDRTQLAIEVLARSDPAFRQLADALYPGATPDEVWFEVFGKGNPDPADLHVPAPMESSRKKKTLEGIGIAATGIGAALGVKDSGETFRAARTAIKAGQPATRKVARATVAPLMLAGDGIAEQQQIAASRRKALQPVSKSAITEMAATFADSLGRATSNIRRGLTNAEPDLAGENPKPVKPKKPKAEDGDINPATAPANPLVSGSKPYQVGQFLGTSNGKKAVAGVGAGALLLGHHERNVGANQAYNAAYGKRDTEFAGTFSKLDTTKHQVFGFASVVHKDGSAVTDRQGDLISPEDMEESAYEFVLNSRVGGHMHQRDEFDAPHHVSDLIESFAVTPDKLMALGIPEEVAKGVPIGWWTGFKVHDPDVWDDVINKRLTGFSVHGRGVRTPISDEDYWSAIGKRDDMETRPNYRRTRRVKPAHAAEGVAGAGLVAYGAPRLAGQLGNHAPRPKVLVELGDAVAHAKWPESVANAARAVPVPLRPAAATVIGMGLLAHARPVTEPHYVRSQR